MSDTTQDIKTQETCPETRVELVFSSYDIATGVEQFASANGRVVDLMNLSVLAVIAPDQTVSQYVPAWIKTVRYPSRQERFSIGRTVNYGIKRTVGDIVVKTDPDIVFTPETVELVRKGVKPGRGVVCICAETPTPFNIPTDKWRLAQKRCQGYGACFALHRDDWRRLCGYDERLFGWGADDTEMLARCIDSGIEMETSAATPLYHVTHPPRRGSHAFPFRSKENLSMFTANHAAGNKWRSESWGEGIQ